jgi:hypothetical protein
MPVRPALACAVLGIFFTFTFFALQYGKPFDLAEEPITVILGVPVLSMAFAGTTALLYHSLHQLRVIGRVHRYIESIEVLDLDRLHAFAGVTAATGVALLALGYIGVLLNPDPLSNPQVIAWSAVTTAAAVACFFGPLFGIRGLIAAEKSRRLETVNRLLDQALSYLHRRVEEGDLADADAVNKDISSLLAERDVLARISTWPWAPETIRGFSAAIVIPIGLWLVFRFLEQVL